MLKVEQSKLIVRRADEATKEWVIEELDIKLERSDKVSNNKQEQKNRGADRNKLLVINPSLSKLDEALIHLRNWRRDNQGKRMTTNLYEQIAKDFA